jgi:tetratricopeptide (TPR) repeat protein
MPKIAMRRNIAVLPLLVLAWSGCSRDPASQEAKYLARGKKYLQKKDYARAVLEFRNAIKPKPQDAEPWYQLALAYSAGNQPALAIRALQEATRLNPKHSAAQLRLSEMMVQSRDPAVLNDAVNRLNPMLETDRTDPEVFDTLALADLKLKKPEDAEKLLREALARFPGHLKSSADLAAIQFAKRDMEGAEQTLKEAVAKAPQSSNAAFALAHLYILEHKNSAAEVELQRSVQLDSKNVPALLSLASLQVAEGNVAAADQTYRHLAALPGTNLSYIHAAFLYREGKHGEAIQELEKLARAHPEDARDGRRLVVAYLAAGRRPEAMAYLAGLLKKNPKDTDSLLLRSHINLDAGHLVEAEQDLQAVRHFMPDSAAVHYGLSQVYARRGLAHDRLQELGEVLHVAPRLLTVRVELAQAQLVGGQPQAALDTLQAAPPEQKSTVVFITARNWVLLALNRVEEAQAGVEEGLRIQTTPALVLERAALKTMKKDLDGARQDAEQVLRMNPANLGGVNLAVQTALQQKQPAIAIRILHQTAVQNARSPRIQTFVGQWLQRLDKADEARDAFQRAKQLDPQYTAADLSMAALDLQQGHVEAARTSLSGIVAKAPENLSAQIMLANLEYSAKNLPAALAHYRAVVDANPDNVIALNAEAYLLAQQNPDSALKLAQHALDLAPGNASVEDTLGWIYYHQGHYTNAVELLREAVSKQPTAVHHYHLALCYLKVGDSQQASQNLQEALAKDPKVAEAEAGWQ